MRWHHRLDVHDRTRLGLGAPDCLSAGSPIFGEDWLLRPVPNEWNRGVSRSRLAFRAFRERYLW